MSRKNQIEMRAHVYEIMRERENEYLARQLEAEGPGFASRIKNALFGRIHPSQRKETA